MKLTEKEFKKFNNRYIITHYIIITLFIIINGKNKSPAV